MGVSVSKKKGEQQHLISPYPSKDDQKIASAGGISNHTPHTQMSETRKVIKNNLTSKLEGQQGWSVLANSAVNSELLQAVQLVPPPHFPV